MDPANADDLDWLLPVAWGVFRKGGAAAGFTVEDLVQIGAVAAIEADATYSPQGNTLKTWRWDRAEWAMRNAVTHAVRRHRLAPFQSLVESQVQYRDENGECAEWVGDNNPDGAPGPDLRYLMRQCARALAKLPGPQRQLLQWLHAEDRTRADVGRELGADRWQVRAAEKSALGVLRGMMGA